MPIYDVFVSYRRSDGAELAEIVAESLRQRGMSVFFDKEEIKSGEDFTLRIEGALRQAPDYLLIATPDVFKFRTGEKDWVLEEMKIACENYNHDLDKNRMYTLVVPQYVYREVNPLNPSEGKTRETVMLPKAEDWPKEIFDLSKSNRIMLKNDLPADGELREILTSVTRVTHHNMWNAGRRWLMENRKPGRRFASLDISKTIFPHAAEMNGQQEEEDNEFPSMVQEQQAPSEKPEGEKLALFDALARTEKHIYLVGEGGIGKTTGLIHIMEMAYQNRAYSEREQVPLFVELSKAPDTAGRLYANGESTFIYRAIYRQIRQDRTVKQVTEAEVGRMDEIFSADPQTVVTPITALLSNETRPPQYLLLLDGLNEVSRTEIEIQPTDERGKQIPGESIRRTIYEMIVREINHIMKTCPNVQVVLTGRADDAAVEGKNITRWQLSGVDDEAIKTYLDGKATREEIEKIAENRTLLDTLRIPLFLTMYIRLKEKTGITTQGEILHTFFSERGKLLGDYELPYSLRNRLGQVEDELDRSAKGKPNLRLTASMQFFIIDFLLAALGRHMEKNNLFSVDFAVVEQVIRPVLEGKEPTSVCGRFGQDAFPRYKKKGSLSSTASVAEQLKSLIGTGYEAAKKLCLLASSVLGILVDDGKYNYSFIHQHVRDYFAALHVMNSLWIGVVCSWRDKDAAYSFLNNELADKPLGFTLRQMLGEALGEHHNKPRKDEDRNWHYNVPEKTKPCNRNLIPLAMDVYRDHFEERGSYALWNLIQILKDVRGDLSGEDFTRLDLTMIRLNRYHMGRKGCSAKLNGAKLQRELFMPGGHTNICSSVSFSPDGKQIITTSWDTTAKVWDAETFLELGTLTGHTEAVTSASFSPDGKRIVTTSWDNTAKVWDAGTFREVKTLVGHREHVKDASYSPDGKRIVTVSWDQTMKVWDAETFLELSAIRIWNEADEIERIKTIFSHGVNSVSYSPDGKRIVTALEDDMVKVWDAESLRECGILNGHTDAVKKSVYSPDGKRIVTVSDDQTVRLWDAETFQELKKMETFLFELNAAGYSPDGKNIVIADWDKVKILDAETLRELGGFEAHRESIESVSYSPDGKIIVTASSDNNSKVWDAATFRELGTLGGAKERVVLAHCSSDGKRIILERGDCTATEWDAETFRELETERSSIAGFASSMPSGACSLDEKRVVITFPHEKRVRIMDIESDRMRMIGYLEGHTEEVNSAEFSPDGKRIVTASKDKTAKVWDAETFCELGTLIGHTESVLKALYSPDGSQIVTASSDETVRVWDAESFCEIRCLEGYSQRVNLAKYSPDGKRFMIVSGRKIKFWDAETLQELGTLKDGGIDERKTNFSPDGKWIVNARGREIDIWKVEPCEKIKTLIGHTDSVNSAFFSPDGRHILTASDDCTAKIWSAETFECIHTIRNVANMEVLGCDFRNLHPDSVLSDEDKQLLWEYGAEV